MSGNGRKSSFSDSEYKKLINFRERPKTEVQAFSLDDRNVLKSELHTQEGIGRNPDFPVLH